MFRISASSKRIQPEDIKRDNSDVWRYSPDLSFNLRKENFSKAYPEAYIRYREAIGDNFVEDPYDDLDLQLDIDKFKATLKRKDLEEVFDLMLLGMTQEEIAEAVGTSQGCVSYNLKLVKQLFKEFYYDEEDDTCEGLFRSA